MMVYLIKTCDVLNFKKVAKQGVKVQEIELFTKTCNSYVEKDREKAIKDCRKFNKKYKNELKHVWYITEIKMY